MRNSYLEILELSPGATKEQIKKSYRRLSKKYHPDLGKVTSSKQKFIELTEAYDFLMETGPSPHNEAIAYDYDPAQEEYEARRRWAREQAERKAKEREANSLRVDQFLRVVNWVALVLTSIFILDLILPNLKYEAMVTGMEVPMEYQPGGQYSRGRWVRSKDRLRIKTTEGFIDLRSSFRNKAIRSGDRAVLAKSMILRFSKYMILKKSGKRYGTTNPLFSYFIILPLATFLCSIVALCTRRRSVLWNFGSTAIVFIPITIYVILWSSR